MSSVLDASALLALLFDEVGGEVVEPLVPQAAMSSLNWAEVLQKVQSHGGDIGAVRSSVLAAGLTIQALTEQDSVEIAALWPVTQRLGLSIGDRACLALAKKLNVRAVTADRAWGKLKLSIDVTVIR